jgi:hypothetical protein
MEHRRQASGESYLKRLSIPVLDLLNGGHFAESIGEFSKVLNTMCETNGEFFREEL